MEQVEKEKISEVRTIDVKTIPIQDTAKGVDISVRFKHLEAVKNTQDTRFTIVHYPMSLYLGEAVGSRRGNAVVPFTVEVKTSPDAAIFSIKGEAYIKGSPEDIEGWVVPNGEKAPRIWTRIYQESVAMLTILSRFISVPPPPAPGTEEDKGQKK
jgi:hypothetical protein